MNEIKCPKCGEFFEIDEKARVGNDKAVRLLKPKIAGYSYLLNNYSFNNTENKKST